MKFEISVLKSLQVYIILGVLTAWNKMPCRLWFEIIKYGTY